MKLKCFNAFTLDHSKASVQNLWSMAEQLQIQQLEKTRHNRKDFDCGVPPLNDYLEKQAALDVKRKAAGCWVITSTVAECTILGYYTLSAEAIDAVDLPEVPKAISKKLPGYRRFGAALLGRLAVARSQQGQGIEELLLMDAFHRCLVMEIPVVVIVVDPKDKKAADWYERFGFRALTAGRMAVTLLELEARFNELDSRR
ncbi:MULTISPECIES: GNAT family N-acetyltransferase [unclassified Lentimonas]|uniref:GNAT family N-acetyltransferase n=1 Tax=unclassified Lentimonas TaxID=2630993 RepID=UPI001320F981|nr:MULTISPECIES: GNAT family N-acetyltransferase [unclassified Lentimonas]CAA6692835.1 Unannotated [Lentimonas sp. CC10]CAA6695548.1 Unannotated [Lentimonas sp. CC19]CAA7069879.1 Unannotated [Lentimonas sp. CC11]